MKKFLSIMAGVLLLTSGVAVAAVDVGQTDGGLSGGSTTVGGVVSNIPITVLNGSWNAASPAGTQTGRTNRDTIASACDGAALTTPLFNNTVLQSSQSAHTVVNPYPVDGCFTFTLEFADASCGFNLQPNLYLGSFNPANPIENWIGTSGYSTGIPAGSLTFVATVPANATVVYVLNNTNAPPDTAATPCDYTVTVTAEAEFVAQPIPALSWSALISLALLLGLMGFVAVRRKV